MRRVARFGVVLLCLVIAAQAVVLWSVTGRAGFTRYRHPEAPGASGADSDLAALLSESGLEDRTGPMPTRDNAFAFGLLPAGADAHALSVATIAGPALLGALLALWPQRRRRA